MLTNKSLPKTILLIVLLLATLTYLISMDNRQRLLQSSWQESRPMMGTIVSITVRGIDKDLAQQAFKTAFDKAYQIEQRISTYQKQSEITAINNHFKTSTKPFKISKSMADLMQTSFQYSQTTSGAFDITVKPLINLWRKAKKDKKLPDQDLINHLKPTTFNNGAHINNLILQAPIGTSFDFGAIGKGYTADIIATVLESLGIYNYLIDVGRDLLVRGEDAPWRIGIQDPLIKDKSIQTLIVRKKIAIATSGDYEQKYKIGTHILTHIINPNTGWPIKNIAGATVIAPTGSQADAFATAFCILPPQKSLNLANQLSDFKILILQHQNKKIKAYYSKNWQKQNTND